LIAAIMCGGPGTRMGSAIEKPLIEAGGVPLVFHVINSLRDSRKFRRIVAAVSPKTPATKAFLATRGIEIVDTLGAGYSQDLSILLAKLRPSRVFVISADMPVVSSQTVSEIASLRQTMPLLSVVVTKEFVVNLGIIPSVTLIHNGVEYCQSGISIFDTSRHSGRELGEEYVVMDKAEVAANVNTKKDLELAEKLLIQHV